MMINKSFFWQALLNRLLVTLCLSFFIIVSAYADGHKTAPSISQPAKGINFFYLDGRDQEDLVQVAEKLYYGDDACKGTRAHVSKRFKNTLKSIKQAGFEWVRLLISKDFYHIYAMSIFWLLKRLMNNR